MDLSSYYTAQWSSLALKHVVLDASVFSPEMRECSRANLISDPSEMFTRAMGYKWITEWIGSDKDPNTSRIKLIETWKNLQKNWNKTIWELLGFIFSLALNLGRIYYGKEQNTGGSNLWFSKLQHTLPTGLFLALIFDHHLNWDQISRHSSKNPFTNIQNHEWNKYFQLKALPFILSYEKYEWIWSHQKSLDWPLFRIPKFPWNLKIKLP